MFDKLDEVEARYERVFQRLQQPGITDDQKEYLSLTRELSELEKVVTVYRDYKSVKSEITDYKEIIANESDEELRALAKEELPGLEGKRSEFEENLKLALLPKDPNDDKNIILEIRAGAGGDEASLFAEELFRGYTMYASSKKWKMELLSTSDGNAGGYKEVIASISGASVYSLMKYESGVHRVQRVPKTESQGRVHTSTITVAVIPEAAEVEVNIDPGDLKIDTYRSSGNGGQSVNTTHSAVRITHLPTGTVVSCQDGKSQLSNKQKAMTVLASRLLAAEEEKARKEASSERLAQIGTGDRSERIRTYNYPQSRVTDHRIGLTTQKLDGIVNGDFDTVIKPLVTHYQAEALKRQSQ